MEKVIIESISNRSHSFSRIKNSIDDDDQTFIFQGDVHNPNAPEALYLQVLKNIKTYVEDRDLITLYKKKKFSKLKQNI